MKNGKPKDDIREKIKIPILREKREENREINNKVP